MNGPTLLFVHGTGIRGVSYSATFETIKQKVAEHDLALKVRGSTAGASRRALDFVSRAGPSRSTSKPGEARSRPPPSSSWPSGRCCTPTLGTS